MRRIKVLVACGSGIATSSIAVYKVETLCKSIGVDAQIVKTTIKEIPEKSQESGEHHQKRGEKNQKRGNPCFQLGILVHAVTDTFRIVCGMKQIRSSAMSPREPTGIASSAA